MTTKKFSDPKSDPIKAIRQAADELKTPAVKRVRKPATVKEQVATAAVDEQVDESGLYALANKHAPGVSVDSWVIAALKEARQQGIHEGRMTAEFVAEQAAEQYQRDLNGVVRATIANVLESVLSPVDSRMPSVTLDSAKIGTIFDRVTLDFIDQGDGVFTYTIYPGAAKAR